MTRSVEEPNVASGAEGGGALGIPWSVTVYEEGRASVRRGTGKRDLRWRMGERGVKRRWPKVPANEGEASMDECGRSGTSLTS